MSSHVRGERDDVPGAACSSGDSDAARVAEILRGASRAKRDPDLDLMTTIAGLRDADDATIRSALVTLVSDASPD